MTAFVRQRHRRHANPFTVRGPLDAPDWSGIFARQAPFAIDIGCGAGRFVCDLAQARPDLNVVGLEIRQHLVDEVLHNAQRCGLANAHALLANASMHMDELVPERSVAWLSVNFPDPWYKKRHQKRRVVNPEWLTAIAPKLRPGAQFHAMSDYEPIAQEMLEVLSVQPGFTSLDAPGQFAASSTTGLTSEREIKHLGRGEKIYRMRFVYGLAKGGAIL